MLFLLERVNQRQNGQRAKVEAEFAPLVSNPEQYDSMIGYIYRGRYQSASSAAKPRIFTSFYLKEAIRESEDNNDCLNNRRKRFNDNDDTGVDLQ
jgi:hypothetical protein